jgi:glycosyltransferase involved in cell wall biosynthesis
MKLIYVANARIPSEKAHPYQMVQMCEAFAAEGVNVTLLHAARRNSPELRTRDVWGHYGVARNFAIERIPCLDIYPWTWRLSGRLMRFTDKLAAVLVFVTYHLALLFRLARERNAVIYSRNAATLAVIALLWPRRARRAYFEAHTYAATGLGDRLRRWLAPRLAGVVVITGHLRERYIEADYPPKRLIVAPDGIRAVRFAVEGDRATWRERLGWPADAFIVGYMGRFHTLGMDKGVGDLLAAVAQLAADSRGSVRLGLVGGPDEAVERLREAAADMRLPPETILYAGQVPAEEVPGYLRAFDVCAMPFPWTEHFAYYASPMKLFEYMASGSSLVASDLPATAEIVTDGLALHAK